MEKIQILKYILYAKTNKKDVNILTKNNKKLVVSILDYEPEGEMVKYKFLNNNDSKIKIESIVEIHFENTNYLYYYFMKIHIVYILKQLTELFVQWYTKTV